MAKRTNRKAWGLICVLAVLLALAPVGYVAMVIRGADSYSIGLLPRGHWRFERGTNDVIDHGHKAKVEWIILGFVGLAAVNRMPPTPAGRPASTR